MRMTCSPTAARVGRPRDASTAGAGARTVEHPVQVCDRRLDVVVPILAGARLGRQHGAAMDVLEVPVGILEVRLGLRRVRVVMPRYQRGRACAEPSPPYRLTHGHF